MGIFAGVVPDLWARYQARLDMRGKLMGGQPRNPRLVYAWLAKKTGITDEMELQQFAIRHLREMGIAVEEGQTFDQLMAAAEQFAGDNFTTGFKRDENGVYIESRQVKALLKEAANVIWPGTQEMWGASRRQNSEGKDVFAYRGKGPKAFIAERAFVFPDHISLGRLDPDGVDQITGHVVGAQGERNILGYHEFVEHATISFEVHVLNDSVPLDKWPQIWEFAQSNGLGSLRSQGHGQFDIMEWRKLPSVSSNGIVPHLEEREMAMPVPRKGKT